MPALWIRFDPAQSDLFLHRSKLIKLNLHMNNFMRKIDCARSRTRFPSPDPGEKNANRIQYTFLSTTEKNFCRKRFSGALQVTKK
jgi:hypothetical protein